MCIAILNKKTKISKSILRECWTNNPDGAGMLWTNGKTLNFHKEMNDFNEFYKTYEIIRQSFNTPIVLHFRISTAGKINETNCHPFLVSDNLGFVHNGICDLHQGNADHSDTYELNEMFKGLPHNFIFNHSIMELIKFSIGNSKLLFLDKAGKYYFVNEKFGHWDKEGNWFSNYSYIAYTPFKSKYSTYYKGTPTKATKKATAKATATIIETTGKNNCDFCGSYETLTFDTDTHCYLCAECSGYHSYKTEDKYFDL